MLERKTAREASKVTPAKAPRKGSKTSPSAQKVFPVSPGSISIEEHAYYLWEKEGRPENKTLDFWLRAEKEILSKGNGGI
ncbi:MAG: DUF2934 domain-containing protein [bacterium]|nr:DUF2934 domain-containing protein [bacterium]